MSRLVNITNEPISEQLQRNDGGLDVPSGEVWRVNISMGTRERDGSKMVSTMLNGVPFLSIGAQDGGDYQNSGTTETDMILVGGDRIDFDFQSADNNDGAVHIGGWKVRTP
jgi:hypothetical protein